MAKSSSPVSGIAERYAGAHAEIRLLAGPLMNLGDVTRATVPKLTLLSPPRAGGAISTRTFIPHRCHQAIGVLGAVSVVLFALGLVSNASISSFTAMRVE